MVFLLIATVVILPKQLLAGEANLNDLLAEEANLKEPFAEEAKLKEPLAEEANLGEWTTVPRRPTIAYDLDNNPLEIQTDARRGDKIDLKFFWDTGNYYSFQISRITENSPLVILVILSLSDVVYDFTFAGPVHTWKIAKGSEEFKITCDETTVSFPFNNEATLKKPVTEIVFEPGDRASTRYRDTSGEWVDVPQVLLDYNINLYPLHFTTNKAKEQKQQTHVTLYTSDLDYNKKVDIHWDHDDYQFWVDQCNRCDLSQSYAKGSFTTVPEDDEKTWNVEVSPIQLTISCNDVKVYTFVYTDYVDKCPGCTAQMNMNFVKLLFNELNDKAAVSYLGPPPCTALPGSWTGVGVDPHLPAPYHTPLTVRCATGYTLTSGDNTVTCLGEERYEFISQPVCRENHDDDHDNDGNDSNKEKQYLGVGIGSGIAIGLIVAVIVVLIKRILVKDAGATRSEEAINASYKVGKDDTVNL